ncbi:MAG: mannose-1-phosphate guanylyltransferase [FCB group bacterium]|nr:mannose-1-phosphate guanylyltransferase [FCB group bacterium]MBL7120362.1 mannose-1-phosphate guanylyltransferase [Candidatus Neomarinimicrobiota bacterium]
MIAVIMAGGVGSRFWPRSRVERPKQLLDIVSEQTMLRVTYDRLSQITDVNMIYVVAGPTLKDAILAELTEMPEANLIVEPSGKNTAPAIGLVAALQKNDSTDEVMGVFPSDHLITDVDAFRNDVQAGIAFASSEDALVTFGINPSKPATGYGYIKYDHQSPSSGDQIFKVDRFVEKPDLDKAEGMVASGNYLWNGGMFIWSVSSILRALENHLPHMYEKLESIRMGRQRKDYDRFFKLTWAEIKGESIDYGVLEQASNVFVIKSSFDWNDVGSWDALYDISKKDASGNVHRGDIQALNSENCFFYTDDLRISTVGVKDLIVVKSGNALLIVNRNESEQVKQIVTDLKSENSIEYL